MKRHRFGRRFRFGFLAGQANGRPARRNRVRTHAASAITPRIESLEQRIVLTSNWVAQGPGPATDGQVEGVGPAPADQVVGAIHTVVAHPTDADTLWIGATNGGIWRTDDATASSPTWYPQTDNLTSLSIGALELDPLDGTHDTLAAGIGRYSSFGSVGDTRTGIITTTDGGTTWSDPGSGGSLAGIGPNISGIAPRGSTIVTSVNTSTAFTCSDVGIHRSTDAGATFSKISGLGVGIPSGVAFDLASDSASSSTL
ncbi:MAG: hypothetical protein KDA42_19135, partial [Planctomycetales bacterium]|nr:hypothetical protein [Planctomycetales bacterium]